MGKTRSMEPEEWVIQITKLFDSLDIHEDRDRLKHVVHCLTQTSYQWWLEATRLPPATTFIQEDFVTKFYDKFFPKPKNERLLISTMN